MVRRAMPASEWTPVLKDATKGLVASDAVADAGKAPPAHIAVSTNGNPKLPKIDDTADTTELVSLPRKDKQKPDEDLTGPDKRACSCNVAKCSCAQKALPEDANATADDSPGMMLALVPPSDVSAKLAQPGGISTDDMHVTLGYYGKVGKDIHPDQVETVTKCVAMAAEGYKPIKAKIGGVGRFNGSSDHYDNKDVLIAHVDSPDLHDVRDHLIEHVHKCANIAGSADVAPTQFPGDPGQGGPPSTSGNALLGARGHGPKPRRDHGYTPHITLKMLEPDDEMPIHKLPPHEFTFTHLLMSVGNKKTLFPLGERPKLAKEIVFIQKSDDEKRLVTGIVLQPEVVDAQGDIISKEVIEASAYNFLARYNQKTQLGLQHEIMKPDGVELVESFIAPADYILNNRAIKQGTWMMTVRVLNDDLWSKIKTGQIGGFSIGGVAKVQRLVV